MKRRTFLGTGAAALAHTVLGGKAAAPAKRRPNIVFVFSDQQGSYEWSGGGTPEMVTPNLEQIAREGVVFDNCISNNPICVPGRACMLTGQLSQRNGMPYNTFAEGHRLSDDAPTLARSLTAHGYRCGVIGKWHITPYGQVRGERLPPSHPEVSPPGPSRFGFDAYWGLSHNYQRRFDTRYFDEDGNEFIYEGYAPHAQMDHAMSFITRHKDEPFFMYLSWHPPHPTYREAPPEWEQHYMNLDIPWRPNVPVDEFDADASERLRRDRAGAYAHCSALDENMGRLHDHLRALGLEQDTIVVYSSDHGDMLGSQGWFSKRTPWVESARIPFLIKWPGHIRQGETTKAPLSQIDFAPTLLGLAGITPPAEMDGMNCAPYLLGQTDQGPASAFTMYLRSDNPDNRDINARGQEQFELRRLMNIDWRGIYTDRYAFVQRRDEGVISDWMLFDHNEDPYQTANVVEDSAYREIKKALRNELRAWQIKATEEPWS